MTKRTLVDARNSSSSSSKKTRGRKEKITYRVKLGPRSPAHPPPLPTCNFLFFQTWRMKNKNADKFSSLLMICQSPTFTEASPRHRHLTRVYACNYCCYPYKCINPITRTEIVATLIVTETELAPSSVPVSLQRTADKAYQSKTKPKCNVGYSMHRRHSHSSS